MHGGYIVFFQQLLDSWVFSWIILPILIFMCRIFDVSIGTIRIIFVSRGKKKLAPLLGFFEVSIWLIAISQIMQHLDNIACFFAYAGGYAMGNFIGIFIEDKLAMGTLIIRIFLISDENEMKARLYKAGFGVTSIDAHGMNGAVKIVYTVIKRKDLSKAVSIIEECDPKAFYSIEDAKSVNQGIFPKTGKSGFMEYIKPGK
ncbi:DUF2179 domain-containing protein [Clostridium aminobutyricum]|uniref:UPF0316 protein JYB65_02835 n=1 Tax=Clostridium aminobutyricum TaxID=33953 RepID=A0A939IGQ3_CLOAM|nr:DUF2179 domain-containing protein [Clostridium aminobutyricum]